MRKIFGRNVDANNIPEHECDIMTTPNPPPGIESSVGLPRRLSFATTTKSRRLEDGIQKSILRPVQAVQEQDSGTSLSSPPRSGITIVTPSFGSRSMNRAASPLGLLEELFVTKPWQLLLCTIFLNRTQRKQVDCILDPFLHRWPTPESLMIMAQPVDETDGTITNDHNDDYNGNTVNNPKNNDREAVLETSIAELISPMGMTNRRARGILRFCKDYLSLLATKQKTVSNDNQLEEALSSSSPSAIEVVAAQYNDHDENEFTFTRREICSLFYCGDYAADAYQLFIQQDFKSPILSRDHALLAYSYWKRSQRVKI
jgi:endonuclease III